MAPPTSKSAGGGGFWRLRHCRKQGISQRHKGGPNTHKETMPGEDAGRIRAQIAELQQAMMVLGQAMYSGAAATGPGGPERPDGNEHGEPRGEDVVEGEYQQM